MVSVALDGANIDHLVLDEDITVRVGRTGVLDRGQPGSASLVLWLDEWVDVGYKSEVVITDSDIVNNLLTPNVASGTDTLGTTGGFIATGSTIASSTAAAAEGSRSLLVTLTSTGTAIGALAAEFFPVTPGTTWTAVASFRYASGMVRAQRMRLQWYDAAQASLSVVDVFGPLMSASWQETAITAAAPAGAAFVRVYMIQNTTGQVGDQFHVDRIGLWEGDGGSWAMPGAAPPARFVGRVTDTPRTTWEPHPDDPDRYMLVLRIQCAGPLAGWGRQRIGDEPWPAEPVADRAARIAGLVGQPLVVQGGSAVRVIGRDVDSQPGIVLLEELATDCAGWLYDHAGATYLQSLEVRRVGDPHERWIEQDTTWTDWAGTWDEQTGTSANWPLGPTIHLPSEAVLFAPQMEITSLLANRVLVRWGPMDEYGEQAQVVVADEASIAEFGPEDVSIATRLEQSGDAQLRAQLTLERAAWPQWHLPRAEIMWEALDPGTRGRLDAMMPGQVVEVADLPQPAPFEVFQGCVEGWTDQWSWDDTAEMVLRTTTLHLSDIRWSFAVLTWAGIVPDDLTWADIDCTWDQMLTADDLEDAR